MGRDDWYRRSSWTEADRLEFYQRLKRSRGSYHKAQYARIQASYLAGAGHIEPAIDLLNRLFVEFPHESQLAQAHLQKAQCFITEGRIDDAIQEFRATLEAEKRYPKSRTQVWLDFPWFVVTRAMSDLYGEALEFLESGDRWTMFPVDEYRLAAIRAFMADENGQSELARDFANTALSAATKEYSGFRFHPKVGIVSRQDAEIKRRLERLARG